jgi:hypothetical protein
MSQASDTRPKTKRLLDAFGAVLALVARNGTVSAARAGPVLQELIAASNAAPTIALPVALAQRLAAALAQPAPRDRSRAALLVNGLHRGVVHSYLDQV